MSSESNSMPSTVSTVEGPSHFYGAIGTPRTAQYRNSVVSDKLHSLEWGFPTMM